MLVVVGFIVVATGTAVEVDNVVVVGDGGADVGAADTGASVVGLVVGDCTGDMVGASVSVGASVRKKH
jgi:hypothetical protein